jgi:hypothetical protein
VTLEAILRGLIRDAVREELRAMREGRGPSSAGRPAGCVDAPMTTAEATRYCGFKTSAAIRKAMLDGRLIPIGRRGGTRLHLAPVFGELYIDAIRVDQTEMRQGTAKIISLAGVREALGAGGMEVVCIGPKNENGQVGSDSQLADSA